MTLRVLSNLDIETPIDANGATWLDRELTSSNHAPTVRAGFTPGVGALISEAKTGRSKPANEIIEVAVPAAIERPVFDKGR